MATLDDDLVDLIVAESLIDRGNLVGDATLADLGLDSVDLISIVFAVEEKYAVEVPQDAFAETANLGAFVNTLKSYIQKAEA
jgi:acyl carrier protein